MEMMTVSSEWLSIHEKLFKKYQITKLSKIVYDVLVNSSSNPVTGDPYIYILPPLKI